jgi:hypothetical protein
MTHLRFTLAQVMALVLLLGFALAALRSTDPFWASATFTLTLIVISAGLVGALTRKGRSRTTWVGFAVFAWACLFIDLLPPRTSGGLGFGPLAWPPSLIDWGLAQLQPYLRPVPPAQSVVSGAFLTPYEHVGHALGIILFGLVGAVVGRLLAPREEQATR